MVLQKNVKFFTIYPHGGNLIQRRRTIWTNCQYPFNRKPNVKSVEICSSDFKDILKTRWWLMAILDFWSAQLAIFRSTGHPVPSVYVSTQIAQRFARSKKNAFQDGVYGGHFGFPTDMILVIFHLNINLLLHHKYQLNWPCALRDEFFFTRWLWWVQNKFLG